MKKPLSKMRKFHALLALLGTLTVVQADGSVKLYATFPMGGTQMSVLELDTGRTWMIRERGDHGNAGEIIDYDNGDIYHWNTTDGCIRCGDRQRQDD
jgi:hypothetical protein